MPATTLYRHLSPGMPMPALQPRAGLRVTPALFRHALQDPYPVAFLEAEAQEWAGLEHQLAALSEAFPLAIHETGLAVGGDQPLDVQSLLRLERLIESCQPALLSIPLAWSRQGAAPHDSRLPVSYDGTRLDKVAQHVDEVQNLLKRRILIENPCSFIAFETSTMRETDLLREIVRRTGCGLLLDIGNLDMSGCNHGYPAERNLLEFPLDLAEVIRLTAPSAGNLALFRAVLEQTGPLPTIMAGPDASADWQALKDLAETADRLLDQARAALRSHEAAAG